MNKKLTRRQQQFLSQFFDLYQQLEKPVHYVVVAEKLGIGNVTAYEMLRLLEERGLVKAEYTQNPEQHGPGRSTVLFFPTQESRNIIERVAGDTSDWEVVKTRIFEQLHHRDFGSYENLIADLMARISEHRPPLIYVTELITAMLLTLASLQSKPEMRKIMESLQRIGLPGEIGLSALSGISLALSSLERINLRFSSLLLSQLGKYESALSQLSDENRHRLSDFTRELMKYLNR